MRKICRFLILFSGFVAGAFVRLHSLNGAGAGRSGSGAPAAQAELALLLNRTAGARAGEATRLRTLMAWLPAADSLSLRQMAGNLLKNQDRDGLELRLLMARWAEVNPSSLQRWASGQAGGGTGWCGLHAMEAWARVDFRSAWRGALRPETRAAALLGLTAGNPAVCLQLLRGAPSLLEADPAPCMDRVLVRLAGYDAAGTAALLAGRPDRIAGRYGPGVALVWVRRDPAAALAWMVSLPPAVRGVVAREAGIWLARHHPDRLPGLLQQLPPGSSRTRLAAAAFACLARRDPAAARFQLETMPAGPSRQYCRALLLQQLVRAGDDTAAVALAGQLDWNISPDWSPEAGECTAVPVRGSVPGAWDDPAGAVRELIIRLAARDPEQLAGILFAAARPLPEELVAAAAGPDPAALAGALQARSADPRARDYTGQVVASWAGIDPVAAARWVDATVPPGPERFHLEKRILSVWGEKDPVAVVLWASPRTPEVRRTVWGWLAERHPLFTAASFYDFFRFAPPESVSLLLEQLPPARQRDLLDRMPDDWSIGNSGVITRWLGDNPEEATLWVSRLPSGLRRTSSTRSLVQWLLNAGDFESAISWAVTLPAAEDRDHFLKASLRGWAPQDPEGAAAAIRLSGIPPEDVDKMLRYLRSETRS